MMIPRFIRPVTLRIFKATQSSIVLRNNNLNIYALQVAQTTPLFSYRLLSDDKQMLPNHDVDYEQVKSAITNENICIIDVREPDEIKELGKIPNSINIPLGNVHTALSSMTDDEFKKNYNRIRPSENCEIIFYCMIGKRSGMAQKTAYDLGYTNVKNYVGSYTDWVKKST